MTPRLSPSLLAVLALVLLAWSEPSAARAQTAAAGTADPEVARSIRSARAGRVSGPIRVDGRVDEEEWRGAERVSGFTELMPREGAEPPVRTEVLLAYDESHLYVAFVASDPDPRAIRATLQPRDRLWSDDWVGILLDPYGDSSLGYYFLANPIGVQADLQMSPQREDASIDFVYTTAGQVTADGYVIEMAIPFRSLRFPTRPVHTWGVMLVRTYPRSSRHYLTWPSMSRNDPCQLCQLGELEGLREIRSGGNLEIIPAVVVAQAGRLQNSADPGSFDQGRVRAEPSLNAKYAPRRGWMAEATLNPDFSQVESDAAQVDVNTTFALFYAERRPFFQEGMELYQTPLNVFYSRSVNSPAVATKLTGRSGRTGIGYIGARDEHTPFVVPFQDRTAVVQAGKSFTNVLRMRQNFGGSHLGALLTDRRLDGGGSGTSLSADGRYRFRQVYSLSGHLVLSHTREPNDSLLSRSLPRLGFGTGDSRHTAAFDGESFTGRAASLYLSREARGFSWNLLYMDISPTYRADTGFQSQNDFRRATGWTGYSIFPNRRGVERVTASLFGGGYWNHSGEQQQAVLSPGLSATLPRQTQVSLNGTVREELFRGVQFEGLRDVSLSVNSNFSDAVRFGFNLGAGRRIARTLQIPEVGTGRNAQLYATIKPLDRVVVEPSISYERLHTLDGSRVFSGYIARSRFNYQHNRELNFRVVSQYNDFRDRLDLQPLLVYQLNPFSIFYIGSTSTSSQFDTLGMVETERQYFAKLQYLFRR